MVQKTGVATSHWKNFEYWVWDHDASAAVSQWNDLPLSSMNVKKKTGGWPPLFSHHKLHQCLTELGPGSGGLYMIV